MNKTKPVEKKTELETETDYVMISNDVYGINDAINNYYNIEGGYLPPEYRNVGASKTFTLEELNQLKQDRQNRSNRWYDEQIVIPTSSTAITTQTASPTPMASPSPSV